MTLLKVTPKQEHYNLYSNQTIKAIAFPDHITRLISLNDFEWSVLNWMIDGEKLTLSDDILPIVHKWSNFHYPSENFINESFRELLDSYLYSRIEDWGAQTIDMIVMNYKP